MKREVIYSVRGPKTLPEMTWEEVAEELRDTDLVIFPIGSTEEHGPHMPLLSDTIQGTEVTRRLVARLADDGIRAVAGPPIPFGVSVELMDFPGTISVAPATLMALLKDVCNSLIKHGFRKFVLIASHAENLGVVYSVVQEISQEPGVRIMALNWLPPLRKRYGELLQSTGVEGHGGQGETARVLAAIPELVQMQRAKVYHPEAKERFDGDDPWHFGGGVFDPPRGMKEETPVGSIGNPLVATAEIGERCYDVIMDFAVGAIKRHFGLQ